MTLQMYCKSDNSSVAEIIASLESVNILRERFISNCNSSERLMDWIRGTVKAIPAAKSRDATRPINSSVRLILIIAVPVERE